MEGVLTLRENTCYRALIQPHKRPHAHYPWPWCWHCPAPRPQRIQRPTWSTSSATSRPSPSPSHRGSTRSTHGEANYAFPASRAMRSAAAPARARWTAASCCVSAASVEEDSRSSSLRAHGERAHRQWWVGVIRRVGGARAHAHPRARPLARSARHQRAEELALVDVANHWRQRSRWRPDLRTLPSPRAFEPSHGT